MQSHWTRRYWLASCIVILLFAAGCFQPAGGGLEATNAARSMPTFTPIPTETPLPTDTPEATPTETPPPGVVTLEGILPFETETPDPLALLEGTAVAALPEQQDQVDDLIGTATAMALGTAGQPLQEQEPTETIDPLALRATQVVREATQTAGAPFTQTAQAILGVTSTPEPSATVVGATPAPSGSCVHTVVAGQNLFRISLQYNTTVDALAAANGILNPNMIFVGQEITIPGCGTSTLPGTGDASSASGTVHIVQQGETLFEISLQYGVTVNELAARNGISNINLILINQEIVIP